MATLRDQLTKLLPDVLPAKPEDSKNGTDLLALVKARLDGDYADATIRSHFSVMAGDPTSPIAKVDQGHGYYLRDIALREIEPPKKKTRDGKAPAVAVSEGPSARDQQREEKFRAFYMRFAQMTNQFPMHVEHTRGTRQPAGINKWKFPDVVVLRWEVGEATDQGFRLESEVLEVKKSLGEQPFKLMSVELKTDVSTALFREAFFQCVSNSKWAHSAQLAIASRVADETLAEELRRLGTSYDVSVVSYGLDNEYLDSLPIAEAIHGMEAEEFETLAVRVEMKRIATGRDREALDWEHLRDLRAQSSQFNELFRWIATCLEKKTPFQFSDWKEIVKVEKKYK